MFNKKEYKRQWKLNHPKELKAYDKQYNLDHKKERKQWYIDHKEERNEYSKQWNHDHKEEIATNKRKWNKENPEYYKQYYLNNREALYGQNQQYRKDNPECDKQYRFSHKKETAEYMKQHLQTPEGKLSHQRANFKRRDLGFIPLNEYFEGSEGHHISQNFVIYMPKEIHKSLYHNLRTGKNMEKINKLAIEFL